LQKRFTLILSSKPQEVKKVEGFIHSVNRAAHLDEDGYYKLLVATTEAVNNSIIHGNKRDPKKKVAVTCLLGRSILIVRVHDEGPGFNAKSLPDPLAEENLLCEHGRGVFLIRSLMESVQFEKHKNGSNVIMKISLPKPSPAACLKRR
jgi:serine/threonine-protein kinase RsbW